MKGKLDKLFEIVCDIFVLFIVMVYGSLAINTAIDNPRYGFGILLFTVVGYTVYRLTTKKGGSREK